MLESTQIPRFLREKAEIFWRNLPTRGFLGKEDLAYLAMEFDFLFTPGRDLAVPSSAAERGQPYLCEAKGMAITRVGMSGLHSRTVHGEGFWKREK